MKLTRIFLTTLAFSMMLTSMNALGQERDKDYSLAKVGKKIYGVYIFIESEPYHEYDYIATVTVKITWNNMPQEFYEKAIRKAKKNYPYFNGMIFHDSRKDKVDLIRFKGLEVSRGGITIGAKVSFIQGNQIIYGTVVELESSKNKASVKYLNIFEEEKVKRLSYTNLTPLSDDASKKMGEEFKKEIEKYKYDIGQKVTWIKNKESLFGEIISLDKIHHKASIKYLNIYGEEKVTAILYLDLNKITEEDFQQKQEEQKKEIKIHTFKIREKVTWLKHNEISFGTIILMDDKSHNATVEYLSVLHEKKLSKINYLELSKVTDQRFSELLNLHEEKEKKYKFTVGEKVRYKTLTGEREGEILSLDDTAHKATIQFLNKKNEKKTVTVGYLNVFKK